MSGFEFGKRFKIIVTGSSHGPFVGVEISGCPAGIRVSETEIREQMDRRKPGQSLLTTQRREDDRVEIESGIEGGETTGGKIRMMVRNKDVVSGNYEKIKDTPRPGHADYPARVKYGEVDLRGGGFFSGRMTAAFVMAGVVAKKILAGRGIKTMAFAKQIGEVEVAREVSEKEILENTYANLVHTAALEKVEEMVKEVEEARREGDSVGGVIECRITGLPAGMGEPMFDSIESNLAKAVFAIPAVKGIEFGSGFGGSKLRGSQNNDEYVVESGKIVTRTNNCGGILGGLSTGMPVVFRAAVKPTSSIYKPQKTVNLKTLQPTELKIIGRHDPCIAIRAIPVVENVAAICVADMLVEEKVLQARRGEIDAVDAGIVELLAERLQLAREIEEFKKGVGLAARDEEREREVIGKARKRAEELGIPPERAELLFKQILQLR